MEECNMDPRITGIRKMKNTYKCMFGYPTVNVSLLKAAIIKST
jgi:hypothetical protein